MPPDQPRLEEQGIRDRLEDRRWRSLARPARAAGRPQNLRLPRRSAKLSAENSPTERYRRPDWVGKLARERATAAAVLDQLTSRVQRAPGREALVEAGLLLEELSRTKDGAAEVSRRLTQGALDPFIGKGGD
jgi:hypothetical protein